ncbi:MAG: DEAD/DEAH box helicase [Thermoflavifilum sp.]|nr:DEAD/DEAH box helicase [Thermoflavifilum sp.]
MSQSFSELGIENTLLAGIQDMGFETPTPVQQQAIPQLLAKPTDAIVLAQTGTGKTAAFGLPLLQMIDLHHAYLQALILSPTRELALQISQDLRDMGKYLKGLQVVTVYGGSAIQQQIRQLKQKPQIVVATPGRLLDLMDRKAIEINNVKWVILDEADEMLNMGFRDDIHFILNHAAQRQSCWLFSATMPTEIRQIVRRFMQQPIEIVVGNKNTVATGIVHEYYLSHAQHKFETLRRLIDFHPQLYGIVFTRTKVEAQETAERLARLGYDADALHGDLSQTQRDKVMERFRSRNLRLLLATDVAARGIDVDNITHVVHYGLPDDLESYTHRSGRTGRAGRSGISISIIHLHEMEKLRKLEQMLHIRFVRRSIPTGPQICEKQLFHYFDQLKQLDMSDIDIHIYLEAIKSSLSDISRDELIERIAAYEFQHLLKHYAQAKDLNVPAPEARSTFRENQKQSYSRKSYADSSFGYITYRINIGRSHGLYKASLLQWLLDHTRLPKQAVGKIILLDQYSLIELDPQIDPRVLEALNGTRPLELNDQAPAVVSLTRRRPRTAYSHQER